MNENFIMWSKTHFRFIRPTAFGYHICPPFHTGGARVVNEWIIHYVFSGTGIFQTKNRTYYPKAGDMFVIRPDEWVYYAADEEDPWTYAWFDFYCDMQPPAVLEQDVLSDERLGAVFLSTLEQGKRYAEEDAGPLMYGKLFELFGMLDSLYPAPGKPSNSTLIHEAIIYMLEHYRQHITVDDVARHVHMEYSHFVTLFRDTVGITPGKYLTNMRLSYSTGLLLHTDWNAKSTAERSGYKDPATFSRAFKKQYGMSPMEYVNTYRPHILCDT